ncbi:MAG: prepilin-type N-terminal cleavage/methylation domain-containing protein [Candidatus Omnitrophica bacterium]|nr:prepilin-type N-terminal cleavage/methylation domain-containing protein [Candidatus Omnitrophota bacterium]
MQIGNKKNTGFTLLELMIGAAVLILALVGLIAAYIGCFALNEKARNLTVATNDAQCVMEEIRDRNTAFNITQEDWSAWAATDPPDGGGCSTLDNETITVTYPSGTGARPLEIIITVSWTEKGRQRNTQISTLLTER